MALRRVKLGELIELVEKRNDNGAYGAKDVRGVNNLKRMISTKADISSRDLTKFQVVEPGVFFFNHRTSRNGSKLSITYNYDDETHITTEDYVLFRVRRNCGLNPMWLYLFFCRAEFDRYCIMNSWGSSTEFYNWEDLCAVELELPPIEVQRKYVAVYEAMLENQRSYERGLDDLKLTCDGYIEKLMHGYGRTRLADYLCRHDCRNIDNSIKNVKGVSTAKEFREPTAKVDRNNLSNYKIVRSGWFSFVQTTHNEKCFAFALNATDEDVVVTSVNEVFSVDCDKLVPEYLAAIFRRKEFDRYARFHSWGSARETFTWNDLQNVEIPIPDIKTQRAIADIYKVYRQRSEINERLKAQLKDICPVLIKGSIDEARAS